MISTNFIELNESLKTFILSVAVGSEVVIEKLLATVNRHLDQLEMYIVFLFVYEDGYILRDRIFFDTFVKALNFATTQFGYSYLIYKDHRLIARSYCEGVIA